ncbi:MAG: hypothetical protein K2X32_14780, partial [Phycisphaerales bacterium]|nr:hypothetical protein [Phycisphaerales bacterium]
MTRSIPGALVALLSAVAGLGGCASPATTANTHIAPSSSDAKTMSLSTPTPPTPTTTTTTGARAMQLG